MINEPGKIMVRLPKGHIWTTENIRRLSNLATFLVQLSQLLLVLYLQLGQLLQLSIVPCAIMSWAAIGQRRRDVPNQNPVVSASLPGSRHCLPWILSTPGTQMICNKPSHNSLPHHELFTSQKAITQDWKVTSPEDLIHFLYISKPEFKLQQKITSLCLNLHEDDRVLEVHSLNSGTITSILPP